VTVLRSRERRPAAQEQFVPAARAPLVAFVAGVMALVLVAGWLAHLV